MITKNEFVNLVNKLTDEEFKDLIEGINQNTFEYGWAVLDDSILIKKCWEK